MLLIGKKWRCRQKFKASPIKTICTMSSWLMLLICSIAFLNYMGVFTHLLEKDYYSEFSYPLDVDLQPLVKELLTGQMPDTRPINVFNHVYLKPCTEKCANNSNPTLLFVVKSALHHFKQREAIRQTWGYQKRFSDVEIRRVFLLGTGSDPEIQQEIDLEDNVYHDIVQANFHDDYRNNTLKTMSGLKWAVENCPLAQYVVFSDDDMYISTKNVLRFIRNPLNYPAEESITPIGQGREHRERSLKQESLNEDTSQLVNNESESAVGNLGEEQENEDHKLYAGYVFHSPPQRHKPSKWYVSLDEYPYHLWPPYVTAGAYIVSREALLNLHYGSYYTKYFQFDDIFLALVALKVNINPVHCKEFYFWKKSYSKYGYRDVIASHGYGNPDELRSVWNEQKSIGHA